MRRVFPVLSVALASILHLSAEQPSCPISTPEQAIVGTIASDIPLAKANETLWTYLPRFNDLSAHRQISGVNWEQQARAFTDALVAKAKDQKLESEKLKAIIQKYSNQESVAMVPIAAFRGRVGGREVWIVHFRTELKGAIEHGLKHNSEKPHDTPCWVYLDHIGTLAVALDNLDVVADEHCM